MPSPASAASPSRSSSRRGNDALEDEQAELTGLPKVLSNTWVATVLTLALGLALAFGGYTNIWPLFGASNQLLGA